MLFVQNSGDCDAKKSSTAVLKSLYLSNFSPVDGALKDGTNGSLMERGPASTIGG